MSYLKPARASGVSGYVRFGLSLLVVLTIPGTAFGQQNQQPKPSAPAGASSSQWWQSFGDAQLNELVTLALEGNPDLKVVEQRIEESVAVVKQALSPMMPTLSWDTSVNLAPVESLGFQFGGASSSQPTEPPDSMSPEAVTDTPSLYYSVSSTLNLGVDLDVSGKSRFAYKASKADVAVSRIDLEAKRLALIVNLVSAYYDAVAAKAQLDVVSQQIETNSQLLELTQFRFENGQANAVDVLQQKQQLATTKTLEPKARLQLEAHLRRISVLLGQGPSAHSVDVAKVAVGFPALRQQPVLGNTNELQEQRPDLKAAALRLDSAQLRETSARRQFAPSLRLTGKYGVQAMILGDTRSQDFWGAGLALSVPLYAGGRTVAQLRQREAQTRSAAFQLQSASLNAQLEVSNAQGNELRQIETLVLTNEQAQAAWLAFEEARRRYEAGVGEYLPVFSALGAAQQAQLNVIVAKRDVLGSRISLHQALGSTGL